MRDEFYFYGWGFGSVGASVAMVLFCLFLLGFEGGFLSFLFFFSNLAALIYAHFHACLLQGKF